MNTLNLRQAKLRNIEIFGETELICRFLFPVLNILKFQKNLKHSRKKLNLILLYNNYAL
jgi:hypothetical protein